MGSSSPLIGGTKIVPPPQPRKSRGEDRQELSDRTPSLCRFFFLSPSQSRPKGWGTGPHFCGRPWHPFRRSTTLHLFPPTGRRRCGPSPGNGQPVHPHPRLALSSGGSWDSYPMFAFSLWWEFPVTVCSLEERCPPVPKVWGFSLAMVVLYLSGGLRGRWGIVV